MTQTIKVGDLISYKRAEGTMRYCVLRSIQDNRRYWGFWAYTMAEARRLDKVQPSHATGSNASNVKLEQSKSINWRERVCQP